MRGLGDCYYTAWRNIITKRTLTGEDTKMSTIIDRITVNSDICMGQPTIRGMRITVAFVLKLLAAGMSHEEVLKSYPELEEDDIRQCMEYAAWLAGEYHRPFQAHVG